MDDLEALKRKVQSLEKTNDRLRKAAELRGRYGDAPRVVITTSVPKKLADKILELCGEDRFGSRSAAIRYLLELAMERISEDE